LLERLARKVVGGRIERCDGEKRDPAKAVKVDLRDAVVAGLRLQQFGRETMLEAEIERRLARAARSLALRVVKAWQSAVSLGGPARACILQRLSVERVFAEEQIVEEFHVDGSMSEAQARGEAAALAQRVAGARSAIEPGNLMKKPQQAARQWCTAYYLRRWALEAATRREQGLAPALSGSKAPCAIAAAVRDANMTGIVWHGLPGDQCADRPVVGGVSTGIIVRIEEGRYRACRKENFVAGCEADLQTAFRHWLRLGGRHVLEAERRRAERLRRARVAILLAAGLRSWQRFGSCSGKPLAPVAGRVFMDLGSDGDAAARSRRRRAAQKRQAVEAALQREMRAQANGSAPDDHGFWAVDDVVDVRRPAVRNGMQLDVLIRWAGDGSESWRPITFLIARENVLDGDESLRQKARRMEREKYDSQGVARTVRGTRRTEGPGVGVLQVLLQDGDVETWVNLADVKDASDGVALAAQAKALDTVAREGAPRVTTRKAAACASAADGEAPNEASAKRVKPTAAGGSKEAACEADDEGESEVSVEALSESSTKKVAPLSAKGNKGATRTADGGDEKAVLVEALGAERASRPVVDPRLCRKCFHRFQGALTQSGICSRCFAEAGAAVNGAWIERAPPQARRPKERRDDETEVRDEVTRLLSSVEHPDDSTIAAAVLESIGMGTRMDDPSTAQCVTCLHTHSSTLAQHVCRACIRRIRDGDWNAMRPRRRRIGGGRPISVPADDPEAGVAAAQVALVPAVGESSSRTSAVAAAAESVEASDGDKIVRAMELGNDDIGMLLREKRSRDVEVRKAVLKTRGEVAKRMDTGIRRRVRAPSGIRVCPRSQGCEVEGGVDAVLALLQTMQQRAVASGRCVLLNERERLREHVMNFMAAVADGALAEDVRAARMRRARDAVHFGTLRIVKGSGLGASAVEALDSAAILQSILEEGLAASETDDAQALVWWMAERECARCCRAVPGTAGKRTKLGVRGAQLDASELRLHGGDPIQALTSGEAAERRLHAKKNTRLPFSFLRPASRCPVP
jgi:hypothetical protein